MEGLKNKPTFMGYLPFFDDLPGFEQYFYVPTPSFGLRFIQETVDYPIDVLEYPTRKDYENALEHGYDVVGISFMTFKVTEAIKMAQMAREYGVKELWGGGYGVDTPIDLNKHFHRLFRGHAEDDVSLALTGKPAGPKKHPEFVVDAILPFMKNRMGYLITSMGCDAGCKFCPATTYMPKRIEIPLEEIERVLDKYAELGVPGVFIFDDNFAVGSDFSQRVINMLHERNILFWFESRADDIQGRVEELAEKGLFGVCVGMESLRDEDLEQSHKRESVKQILEVMKELKENDVWFMSTYMYGWDHDTPESIEEQLKKISSLEIPYFQPMVMTPFPGSIIWKEWKDRIVDWDWSHYTHQYLVFDHPHITPQQAQDALEKSYKLFTVDNFLAALDKWEDLFTARAPL